MPNKEKFKFHKGAKGAPPSQQIAPALSQQQSSSFSSGTRNGTGNGAGNGTGNGTRATGARSHLPSLLAPSRSHTPKVKSSFVNTTASPGSPTSAGSPPPPPGLGSSPSFVSTMASDSSSSFYGSDHVDDGRNPLAPSLGGPSYVVTRPKHAKSLGESDGIGSEVYDMYGTRKSSSYYELPYAGVVKGLVPTKAGVKKAFWGTRRRKILTLICMTTALTVLSYLTARVIDALNILNTQPNVRRTSALNLCSEDKLQLTLNANLNNPSSASVDLLPFEATLKLQNGTRLLYAAMPDKLTIESGPSDIAVLLNIRILPEDTAHVREALETFMLGEPLNYTLSLNIRAHFKNIFIFPITLSTKMDISDTLQLNQDEYEYEEDLEDLPNEYEYEHRKNAIEFVDLIPSNEPENMVLGRLGLNLWKRTSVRRAFLALELPPINFAVDVEGVPAAVAQSDKLYYGPRRYLPEDSQIGLITTRVTAGWDNVPGVNLGIDRFLGKEDLHVALRVADLKDHPDFDSLESCFLQRLLEGAQLPILLEAEEMHDNSDTSGNDNEENTNEEDDNSEAELFTLESLTVNNINEQGVVDLRIGADITGATERFGIRGTVPPINALLAISGETEETFEDLLRISLLSGLHLSAENPKIPDARIDVALLSAKNLFQGIDRMAFGAQRFAVKAGFNPSMDPTENTVASALLRSIEVEIIINEGVDDESQAGDASLRVRRRRLSHHSSSDNQHSGTTTTTAAAAITASTTTTSSTMDEHVPDANTVDEYFPKRIVRLNNAKNKIFGTPATTGRHITGSRVKRSLQESNDGNDEGGAFSRTFYLDVSSDDESMSLRLNASGFSSEEVFGGVQVSWKSFDFRLFAFHKTQGRQEIMKFVSKVFDSDDSSPAIDLGIDAYDLVNGALLYEVVNNYTSSLPTNLELRGTYNEGPTFGGVTQLIRAQNALEGDRSSSSTSDSAGQSLDFFQLFHIELVSLIDGRLTVRVNFGLDFGDVDFRVSLPKIAIGLGNCLHRDQPPFVTVSMEPWSFSTATDLHIPLEIGASLDDLEQVVNIYGTYSEGQYQAFCFDGHPTDGNFLSDFVGAVGIDFGFDGAPQPGEEQEEQQQEEEEGDSAFTDAIEILITSDDESACTELGAVFNQDLFESLNGTGIGWGQIDLNFGAKDDGSNAFYDIISFHLDEAYIGPLSDYAKTHFNAPDQLPDLNMKACIVKDDSLDIASGAEKVRNALQRIIDKKNLQIEISGSIYDRATSPTATPASDSLVIPGNILELAGVGVEVTEDVRNDAESSFELTSITLNSIDNSVVDVSIEATIGDIGLDITLPSLDARLASREEGEPLQDLLDFGVSISRFGYAENVPLDVGIIVDFGDNWNNLFEFGGNFIGGTADAVLVHSKKVDANYLSKIIPEIVVSLDDDDANNDDPPLTPPEPSVDLEMIVSSTNDATTLTFEVKLETELQFSITYPQLTFEFYDGIPGASGVSLIGTFDIPGNTLQGVSATTGIITLTIQGTEVFDTATNMFTGEDIPAGFKITSQTEETVAGFTIPAILTTDVALGADDSTSEASSSFELLAASILGANEVGGDGTFPCILDGDFLTGFCDHAVRNDDHLSGIDGGVTLGISVGYNLQTLLESLKWSIRLESDVWALVAVNGFELGRAGIRATNVHPLVIRSTDNRVDAVAAVEIFGGMILEARKSLGLLLEGADTVLEVSGFDNANHISGLVQGLKQAIPLLNPIGEDAAEEDDEDSGFDIFEELDLILEDTTDKALTARIGYGLEIDFDGVEALLGDLQLEIDYGFTPSSDPDAPYYESGGVKVAEVTTTEALKLVMNGASQYVSVLAKLSHEHNAAAEAKGHQLISDAINGEELPLRVRIRLRAHDDAVSLYGYPKEWFEITTYATPPKRLRSQTSPVTGLPVENTDPNRLVQELKVNLGGTAVTVLTFDLKISVTITIRNPVPWPVLISGYSVKIVMEDPDGTDAENNCLWELNPCSLFLCSSPYSGYRNIIENNGFVSSGNNHPLTSVVDANFVDKFGHVDIDEKLNVDTATAGRVWDEFNIKNMFCGGLVDGTLQASLQSNRHSCNSLACTYVAKIGLNLLPMALSFGDSCAQAASVGLDQFSGFTLSHDQPFTSSYSFSGVQAYTNDAFFVSTMEPFRVRYTVNGANCAEGFSIIFRRSTFPVPLTTSSGSYGCNGAGIGTVCIMARSDSCNRMALVTAGVVGTMHKESQAVAGGRISSSGSRTIDFTYDAMHQRARIDIGGRHWDFDLNLKYLLNRDYAFMALGGASDGCSFSLSNIRVYITRTDSGEAQLEGRLQLPKPNEQASLTFRARDPDGRLRGMPGNQWEVRIEDEDGIDVTTTKFTVNPGSDPDDCQYITSSYPKVAGQVYSNCDGSYEVRYKANTGGRYAVFVRCTSDGLPCINSWKWSKLTDQLFIRRV